MIFRIISTIILGIVILLFGGTIGTTVANQGEIKEIKIGSILIVLLIFVLVSLWII